MQTLLVLGGLVNRLLRISPFFLHLFLCLYPFLFLCLLLIQRSILPMLQDFTFRHVNTSLLAMLCMRCVCFSGMIMADRSVIWSAIPANMRDSFTALQADSHSSFSLSSLPACLFFNSFIFFGLVSLSLCLFSSAIFCCCQPFTPCVWQRGEEDL